MLTVFLFSWRRLVIRVVNGWGTMVRVGRRRCGVSVACLMRRLVLRLLIRCSRRFVMSWRGPRLVLCILVRLVRLVVFGLIRRWFLLFVKVMRRLTLDGLVLMVRCRCLCRMLIRRRRRCVFYRRYRWCRGRTRWCLLILLALSGRCLVRLVA